MLGNGRPKVAVFPLFWLMAWKGSGLPTRRSAISPGRQYTYPLLFPASHGDIDGLFQVPVGFARAGFRDFALQGITLAERKTSNGGPSAETLKGFRSCRK